jgi:uncharacterized protein (DUF2141 family)
MGGPQDKEPPKLVSSRPGNNSKNFKGSELRFEFNEFIQPNNPNEEIIITPSLGKKTKYLVKKNELVIVPELSLAPNTTYSINFREGIQDITERNKPENLQLAFSTGPTIDSLFIKGSLREALTEKIPDNVTVAIYQSDTFNIFKHTPVYFTKSNKAGEYRINNLKEGHYYLYAFQDKNKNLKVDSRSERFGFLAEPVILDTTYVKKVYPIQLFMADTRQPKVTTIRHSQGKSRLRLNKPVDSIYARSVHRISYNFTDNQAELDIYHSLPELDSVPVYLSSRDSLGQPLDTTIFVKTYTAKFIKEEFKIAKRNPQIDHRQKTYTISLYHTKPLTAYTRDSIFVQLDSATQRGPTTITFDTLRKLVNLKFDIPIDSNHRYQLRLGRAAFISNENDSSKADAATIDIRPLEELATLSIEVETATPNYLLQLITPEGTVAAQVRNPIKHVFTHLDPKEYKIRVLLDDNRNGRWDPGNILLHIPPELVHFHLNSEGKYPVPLRANWEVGPLLITF